MNTYTAKASLYPGEPTIEFVPITKVFTNTGDVKAFLALGTTRIAAASSPVGELGTVYAYTTKEHGKVTDIVWSTTASENLSNLAISFMERDGYGPLNYASGVQMSAKFLKDPYHHLVKPGYRKTFLAYQEDGETHFIHLDEAKAMRKDLPVFKADWIFGLSEFIYRIDAGNLQNNSVLVITYCGDEYQTREYVLRNAIRKGYDGLALTALADFLATGKVVFAGMADLFTGTIIKSPRELSISGLAEFEFKAGRDPQIGVTIGEDVAPRVELYLDHVDPENLRDLRQRGLSTRYRFDENLSPIAKLR